MFSPVKIRFAGNVTKQTALKMKPIGSQWKVENERVYQTAISDFQNFESSEILGKQSIKIILKNQTTLLLSDAGMYVKRHCLVYMCTLF